MRSFRLSALAVLSASLLVGLMIGCGGETEVIVEKEVIKEVIVEKIVEVVVTATPTPTPTPTLTPTPTPTATPTPTPTAFCRHSGVILASFWRQPLASAAGSPLF